MITLLQVLTIANITADVVHANSRYSLSKLASITQIFKEDNTGDHRLGR